MSEETMHLKCYRSFRSFVLMQLGEFDNIREYRHKWERIKTQGPETDSRRLLWNLVCRRSASCSWIMFRAILYILWQHVVCTRIGLASDQSPRPSFYWCSNPSKCILLIRVGERDDWENMSRMNNKKWREREFNKNTRLAEAREQKFSFFQKNNHELPLLNGRVQFGIPLFENLESIHRGLSVCIIKVPKRREN